MPIDYQTLLGTTLADVPVSYEEQDVMLYAIGVGLGADPLDRSELRFVSACSFAMRKKRLNAFLSSFPTLSPV